MGVALLWGCKPKMHITELPAYSKPEGWQTYCIGPYLIDMPPNYAVPNPDIKGGGYNRKIHHTEGTSKTTVAFNDVDYELGLLVTPSVINGEWSSYEEVR